jgi:hypothetical protein
MTDLGMTGPYNSVIGRRTDRVLHRFITQMPSHFEIATDDVRLCGAVVTVETDSGQAMNIERLIISQDTR